ncbi:ATP-grasp fold amidoligase family protein [Shimia aestuarii]|nr:ATP-grasp fold amidoligase family protein [Shimia aestuarii]
MATKIGQKAVAQKAGVYTAEIYQGPFTSLSEFELNALPNRFVIKPIVGSGSNGVFLLEKRDGLLFDIVSKKSYPPDLNSLHSAGLSRFEGCPLIAEELIGIDGLPSVDWKVFAFFGEIGFIRQMDLRNPQKCYKMWSSKGQDLGKIDKYSLEYNSALPPPNDFEALVNAARAVSLSINTPFVRVDLYESKRGPSLGEVTFAPGSLWKHTYLQIFTPEWDRKLGEMWEEAQARLIERVGDNYIP